MRQIIEVTRGTMPNLSPSKDNIAAVIVTYNPDLGLANRLKRVISQVAYVIIVDNGSTSLQEKLYGILSPKVEIIENSYNIGLASALNQGVRRAMELGFSWVLTLDQDSLIDHDMINCLLEIYHLYPFPERIGLIGSNARSPISGRLYIKCPQELKTFMEVKTCMTSGSLLSLRVYEQIGPFRDDFFIEAVDLEYCLRLRKNGFKVLISCRPLMTHAAGKAKERRLFRRIVIVPDHEPWRYYYQLRNLMFVIRSYFWQEPDWVFVALINFMKALVRILLFEDNRLQKFNAIWQGIRDGIISTKGGKEVSHH